MHSSPCLVVKMYLIHVYTHTHTHTRVCVCVCVCVADSTSWSSLPLIFAYTCVRDLFIGGVIYLAENIIR
jgi:hypothetical protein